MTGNELVDHLAADLRALLSAGKIVDVGKGAAEALDIKPTKMVRAVQKLTDEEGHRIFYLQVKQKDSNLQTTMKILVPAHMTFPELYERQGEIVRLERLSNGTS